MTTGIRKGQIRGYEQVAGGALGVGSVTTTEILDGTILPGDLNSSVYGVVGDLAAIDPDDAAAAGTSVRLARADHQHAATTGTPVAVGTVLAEGAGTGLARDTHVHVVGVGAVSASNMFAAGVVDTTALASGVYAAGATIAEINPDDAQSGGASATLARGDHQHACPTNVPVAVGTALAEGAGTGLARDNHVHTIGTGAINVAAMFAAGVVDAPALQEDLARIKVRTATATTDSAAIGAETVVLTITSMVFEDGRAYMLTWGSGVVCSVAASDLSVRVRKTNATGTVYCEAARNRIPAITNTYADDGLRYLKRATAAGNLTTDVVLTYTASGGTMTQKGSATMPRHMTIIDIGDADDWTQAVAVT